MKEGDEVIVKSIKKRGVIIAVLSGDQYQVQIASLKLKCREKNLSLAPKQKSPPVESKTSIPTPINKKGIWSLDLHGKKVEEAIRETEQFINDAILAGADKAEIIHGVGTGALKQAVTEYLERLSVVKSVKLENPGTTVAFL